jgi:Uncharacterized protein conserved in bacteria (DUF2147)
MSTISQSGDVVAEVRVWAAAVIAGLSCQLPLLAQTAPVPILSQDWALGETNGIVLPFRPCGPQLCATLVALGAVIDGDTGELDVNNRTPALRTRRLCGLQIISGLTGGRSGWTGGRAYNLEDGSTLEVSLKKNRHDHYYLSVDSIPLFGTLPLLPAPANPLRPCR